MAKPVILIWECDRCPAVVAQSYQRREDMAMVELAFVPEPFHAVRDPNIPDNAYVLCEAHFQEFTVEHPDDPQTLGIAVEDGLTMRDLT